MIDLDLALFGDTEQWHLILLVAEFIQSTTPGTWDTEKQFCLGLYVRIYTRGFQCLYSTTKWIKMGNFPNLAYQQYLELGFPFENLDWGLFVFTHRPGRPDPKRCANSTRSKVEGWKDAIFCMKKYGQALGGEFYLECLGWLFQGGYYVYTAPSNSPFSVRKSHLFNKNPRHWFDLWQTWG